MARGARSVVALGLLVAVAFAQKPANEPVVDPYTGGDPELLAHSGIEMLGPFHLAEEHLTQDVEAAMSHVATMCWAETRHFKIGIGLKRRPLPEDKTERRELLAEVAALGKVIPKLRRRPREIDSWLLVHLYALRLETLYADFCERIGFDDQSPPIPKGGADSRGWRDSAVLGSGPYLGQHGKFCVVIVEKNADLERYLRRFAGREGTDPVSHHFLGSNSLLFITTPDARWDALKTERGLHCNVFYGVVRNFTDGYRGFTYEIPAWVGEGLAHWYRRRVDEKYDSFRALSTNQIDLVYGANWQQKTRARVETDVWVRADKLLAWRSHETNEFQQHVMMWSRMDYLLTEEPEGFRKFLNAMKTLPTTGISYEQVLQTQQKALQEVFGLDAASFDEKWCQWVRKKYQRPN